MKYKKVIILGIDGLDPHITEKLMEAGELPNFSRLKETGSYRRLQTSNPAQSPVVWTSIATGTNPGYHGIFDFITRNPKNYIPELAIMKVNPRNLFARRETMFLPTRKGIPFWQITSDAGIPTSVIKWPLTFPPEKVSGHMLSGLGVPDIRAYLGRYSFYTTAHIEENNDKKGDMFLLPKNKKEMEAVINGPDKSKIKFKIIHDSKEKITLVIGKQKINLNAGEWSDWIETTFTANIFRRVSGICRFYLSSIKPDLKLYLSPIHVNPEKPAFPVSYPDEFCIDLTRGIGAFHTLGIPEDTNALNDACYDEDAFLESCDSIMKEREKILWYEMERFKEGLLAFVFDTTDRIQHMFWDREDKYKDILKMYYQRMDKILGNLMNYIDEKTVLIILSDHGFNCFKRTVHLNSWLMKNGLMKLKETPSEDGGSLFKNVDWEKTSAYAVGFTSIYLNLKGREEKGIVNQGEESEEIKRKIIDIFERLKDPQTNDSVISKVYRREDIFNGPYIEKAPDLIVGFKPGYRMSWQTAIGGIPEKVIEDNEKKWEGDHIIDPEFVPGVFFSNFDIKKQNPSVMDIAPTILKCFEIHELKNLDGDFLI